VASYALRLRRLGERGGWGRVVIGCFANKDYF
jgi:hypothetical protein